jgi:hypothetical protein
MRPSAQNSILAKKIIHFHYQKTPTEFENIKMEKIETQIIEIVTMNIS